MSSDPNNPIPTEPNTALPSEPLTGDDLKKAIQNQVEFYFSPNNLPSDSFLLSKMDEEHFVPISLVATFAKMKALSSDQNTILEALENSETVEISPDKTKIRYKEEKRRNGLILHHLPEGTTEEELQDIFKQGNFAPQIKSDINNCCFATFNTEDEATEGLEFIKNQKIRDAPIRARLKPEPVLQNIYNPTSNPPVIQNSVFYPNWTPSMVPYYMEQGGDFSRGYDPSRGRGYKKNRRGEGNRRNYDGNRKKRGQNRKGKGRDRRHPPVQLGPNDFPPLPSSTSTKNTGYSGEFKMHKMQDFVDVIKNLSIAKDPNLPNGFPVVDEPNTNLECENIEPISAQDLSSSRTQSMSERVKKSRPRSASNKNKKGNKDSKNTKKNDKDSQPQDANKASANNQAEENNKPSA